MYNLCRKENEIMINDYNPLLLLLWKANIDIQYINDNLNVLNRYISSYITKSEKTATDTLWELCNNNRSLRGALKSFALQSLKKREIGVFEASDKILGHNLYYKSATIKWLGKKISFYQKK